MSRRDKLLKRLETKPTDFTWDGSRRKFYNPDTGALISLHIPHPQNVLKAYQVKDVLDHLKEAGKR